MTRLVTIITRAVLLIGSVLFGSSDKGVSVADTSVPDNEVASGISKANNSPASATIMITMYTSPDE